MVATKPPPGLTITDLNKDSTPIGSVKPHRTVKLAPAANNLFTPESIKEVDAFTSASNSSHRAPIGVGRTTASFEKVQAALERLAQSRERPCSLVEDARGYYAQSQLPPFPSPKSRAAATRGGLSKEDCRDIAAVKARKAMEAFEASEK